MRDIIIAFIHTRMKSNSHILYWKPYTHRSEILSYAQLEISVEREMISVEMEASWLVKMCNFLIQLAVVNLLARNSDVMSAAKNRSNQSNDPI